MLTVGSRVSLLIAKSEEGIYGRIYLKINVSSTSAVTTIWTTTRDKLFTPKRCRTIPT
jgi:hypothetical protein